MKTNETEMATRCFNEPSRTEPVLEIKSFGTEKNPKRIGKGPILRISNLVLYPGKVYAVIGESGSGKSVLNSLLMGFPAYSNRRQKPKLPNVRFYLPQLLPDGRGYEMKTEEYVREAIYALLATGGMRCDKRKDYIEEAKAKYREELKKKELNWKSIYDAGMDVLSRPIRALSGGQRRRVELDARILAADILSRHSDGKKKVLLILDEPTTGFDWQNQATFLEQVSAVGRKQKNMAVIVVTHALNRLTKKIFDQLIYVQKDHEEIGNEEVECCNVSPAWDVESLYEKIKAKEDADGSCSEENIGCVWQKIFKFKVQDIAGLLEEG